MKVEFLKNISLGAMIGVLAGISFCLILGNEISDGFQKYGTYVLGAVITLMGSGIALYAALANIENAREQSNSAREARLAAARASLPSILANLCSQIENTAELLRQSVSTSAVREKALLTLKTESKLSRDDLKMFMSCIEASHGSIVCEWLTVMLQHQQVYESTTSDLHFDFTHGYTPSMRDQDRAINDLIANWSVLYAITDHLWSFARGGDADLSMIDPLKIKLVPNLSGRVDPTLFKSALESRRAAYSAGTVLNYQM